MNSPQPARDFADGTSLRLVRTLGSWRGRAPDWIARTRLAPDARSVRIETYSACFTVDLLDGSVSAAEPPDTLHARVEALAVARRKRPPRGPSPAYSVMAQRESPSSSLGEPAHFTAGVSVGGRTYTAVFACATGRERVRFCARWRSGFSSCGRFVAYFPARGDRCVLVELATLARRDVSLTLGRTVVGLPLVRAGALEAVVLLRTRKGAPRALACVSLVTGQTRWRRALEPDEWPIALCDEVPDGESLVWTRSDAESLRAYRASDGSLVRTLRGVGPATESSFSPDASYAALCEANVVLRVDLHTGETLRFDDGPDGEITALAWEAGGARYAVAHGNGQLRVHAHADGALLHSAELAEPNYTVHRAMAFEAGANSVLCAGVHHRPRRAVLERVRTHAGLSGGVFELGSGEVEQLVCAPDGSCVWVLLFQSNRGRGSHVALLWSCREERVLVERAFDSDDAVLVLGFAGDELRAVLTEVESGELERYSTQTGELIERHEVRFDLPATLAPHRALVSPDWERLVVLDGAGRYCVLRTDSMLIEAPSEGRVFECNPYAPHSMALADAWCAFVNHAYELELCALEDGRTLEKLSFDRVYDQPEVLALAPDGRTLLVGTRAGVVLEFAVTLDPFGAE